MPRLLLLKLGAIGDVIMTIPAAHAMHAAGYQIDWVCGASAAPILALYPWIDSIVVDETSLFLGSKLAQLRAILALWRHLLARPRYDLCATLYFDRRYQLLTLPIRARRKIALSKTGRSTQLVPGRHQASEYARILLAHRSAIAPDGEQPAQFPPIPPTRLPPNPLPPYPVPLARPRIVLVPAGSQNLLRDDTLRRWPIHFYVELAQALLHRGFEIVLAGGPRDTWASAPFAALNHSDLIGKLSLVESIALFDSADLVVSHDTGPLHMAALTRASILAIFGPTDPRVFLPQRPNSTALWGGEGFACRPCYDGRDFAPCSHNGCMHQVTPALVLAEIDLLLAARRSGQSLPPRIVVPDHTPLVALPGGPRP